MGDRPRWSLRLAWLGLGAAAVLGVTLWALPALVRSVVLQQSSPSASSSRDPETDPEAVDRVVAGSLARLGIQTLATRRHDGVLHAVVQVPGEAATADAAHKLRRRASEQGVELYAADVDGLDTEVRVYAGAELRQVLLLVPDLPSDPLAPRAANRRVRAQLALIVTGLGDDAGMDLLKATVPLTLAVRPYSPYALMLAEGAARAWHQVLVEAPDGASSHGLDASASLADAIAAVPHASGVLVHGGEQTLGVDLPLGVVVRTAPGADISAATGDLRTLSAPLDARRSAWDRLARARHLAARDGVAAVVFHAADPGLPDVLAWAQSEAASGYRLVLATEAARSAEVRGDVPEPMPD